MRSAAQPLPTRYKGILFRSRLEARWAVFFDFFAPQGLSWEYEPEGFSLGANVSYLPDFRVWFPCEKVGRAPSLSRHARWFEVKPDLLSISDEEWQKLAMFHSAKGLTILDGPPALTTYCSVEGCLQNLCVSGTAQNDEANGPPSVTRQYQLAPSALEDDRFGEVLWCSKGRPWADYRSNIDDFMWDGLRPAVEAARTEHFGVKRSKGNN